VFTANIIELEEKKLVPEGIIGEANVGHTLDYEDKDKHDTSYKAILDFGLLDVDKENIEALDPNLSFVGITSDMLVIDIGANRKTNGEKKYSIGDKVYFKPNYMAVARLLNSKFISRRYE
jgi:predicted amino acid racemase